jgi:hypothetical protein
LLKKGTESGVAQVSSWGNPVPHELLEFFHLRESPCFLSGPDDLVVNSDLEDAAFAGDKSHLAGFVLKSSIRGEVNKKTSPVLPKLRDFSILLTGMKSDPQAGIMKRMQAESFADPVRIGQQTRNLIHQPI